MKFAYFKLLLETLFSTVVWLYCSVGQDLRDKFSGAVEAFSRRKVMSTGRYGEQSRHRTSEDVPSSMNVQPDSEKGRTLRSGSSSKRGAISSIRPSSSGEAIDGSAGRLVSSGGRVSTTQRVQPGTDHKPSAFSRAAVKGSRDDPLRSFEFLSIRK